MVFYSSTNIRILKPWAIISVLIRFDLGFWGASKQFYIIIIIIIIYLFKVDLVYNNFVYNKYNKKWPEAN